MLPAEVSGKLGRAIACALCGERTGHASFDGFEDLLTSNVFGALRYLDPVHGLDPVLRDLGLGAITQAVVEFWQLEDGCEPDVIINTGAALVVVETKLHSSFGPDQLAREVVYADRRAAGRPWRLLYVTADRREPRHHRFMNGKAVDGSAVRLGEGVASYFDHENRTLLPPSEIAKRIVWMPWSELAARLQVVRDTGSIARHVRALLDDLLATLDARGLSHIPFRGFASVPTMSVVWSASKIWTAADRGQPASSGLTWAVPTMTSGWSPGRWLAPGFGGFATMSPTTVPAFDGWLTRKGKGNG